MLPLPDIHLPDTARAGLIRGAARLARLVAPTFGPTAKTVLMERRYGKPEASRDGAFIAQRTEWDDPLENAGLKMVRAAACRTRDAAGDGTVTTILMVDELLKYGERAIASGVAPDDMTAGIRCAAERIDACLRALSRPVSGRDELLSLAKAVTGDADLAALVEQAAEAVGAAGLVRCEQAQGREDRLEIRPGMQIETGILRESFLEGAIRDRLNLQETWVLVHEAPLDRLDPLVPILEKVLDTGRPLVIFSEGIGGEALASLEMNMREGVMRCLPVKVPGFGVRRRGLMEDIACATGGRVISRATGEDVRHAGLHDLGQAGAVNATRTRVDLLDGQGAEADIERHRRSLDCQIEETCSPFDREALQLRRARLDAGVAVLHVTGADEVSGKYRREAVRKAVRSVQAARLSGTVPGSGVAYLKALAADHDAGLGGMDDMGAGRACLARALERPLRQIVGNMGGDLGWACHAARAGATPDPDVRDATDVTRAALREAVSCACMILGVGGAVARAPHRDETELLE